MDERTDRYTRSLFPIVSVSFLLSGLALFGIGAVLGSHATAAAGKRRLDRVHTTPAQPRTSGKVRTLHGSGYEPKLTFEEFLNFPSTRYVFEGVVERVLAARYVPNPVFEHVYSPVVIRITALHRGQFPADGLFVLRAFGGIAEGVEFVGGLQASADLKTVGAELLVIAPEPLVVEGDTLQAATAIAVYSKQGAQFRKATYRHSAAESGSSLSVARAQALLSAGAGR